MERNRKVNQRRRYNRVPVSGTVRYQYSRQDGGHATLVNVDHSGLCIRTDRPLRRGQRVMMDVTDPGAEDRFFEMKGVVAWVEPSREPESWRVGIRVYRDEPDTRAALCALICFGLRDAAAVAQLRERHFLFVEWKLAALEATEEAADAREMRHNPVLRARRLIRAAALGA